MIMIKLSTLIILLIMALGIGFLFSPIVMLIEWIKSHKKDGEQNEADD